MAIRKRQSKKGASWQIDYFDPTGKRIRKSFKKRKDAEVELGKRVSLIAEDRYLDRKKRNEHTFKQLTDNYAIEYENQPSYDNAKKKYLENFKEFFGEETLLDNITYGDIKSYRRHLIKKPTPNGTIREESTINREMTCLHQLFEGAVIDKMLNANPFNEGKARGPNKQGVWLKENNKRTRYLGKSEIMKFLDQIERQWFKELALVDLHTGLRRKELINLKWEHIKDGIIYAKDFKTDKTKEIPVDDELKGILVGIKEKNRLKSEYLFIDENGKQITKTQIKWEFNKVKKGAKIKNFKFHDLRHTFASHFMMRGGSIYALQGYLGHQDIKHTERYSHLSPEYKKEQIKVMSGLTQSEPLKVVTKLSQNE